MTGTSVQVAADLAGVIALGGLEFADAAVIEGDPALDAPLSEAERVVRAQPPAERAAVRAMYWRVGIDPTRRRPSSEALLRRVLRGEALPRINGLVDVCNWCSLEFQLPYGLYDLDHVRPPVELRLGHQGEQYAGIRKDAVHVGGRLVLVDQDGPFGNPTSDSARTMVTVATTRALAVIFAPREIGRPAVDAALDATSARAARYCRAREVARFVV